MKWFDAFKKANDLVKLERLEKKNQKLMAKRQKIKEKQKLLTVEYEKQVQIVKAINR